MASVVSPLMSMDASGTVGKAIVFSKWKGRNYVRQHAIPHNPRSSLQYAQRSVMRFLSRAWTGLSPTDKALWEPFGEAINASPFNGFVKHNMGRFTQFRYPLYTPTNTDSTAPTVTSPTWTGGKRQVTYGVTLSPLNHCWGITVYARKDAAVGVFTKERLRYMANAVAGVNTVVITNLEPGTWHFQAAFNEKDGTEGTTGAASGAITVT